MPGGVEPDHPADRPRLGMARVGADLPAERGELGVEHVEDHARLDHDVVGADLDDPPEVAAEVDDQARPERLAGQAGPGPPGVERDRVLGGVADQGDEVLAGPRDDHAERVDLVEAGVVRVGGPLDRLEQEFAAEDAPEIVVNPRPALIHGVVASSDSVRGAGGVLKSAEIVAGSDRIVHHTGRTVAEVAGAGRRPEIEGGWTGAEG